MLVHKSYCCMTFLIFRIFVIAKAEPRMDNVVDNIRKYTDRFIEIPESAKGVLITHMDQVNWTKEQFVPIINNELGFDNVVACQLNTPREVLLRDILAVCRKKHDIKVDSQLFFKLFKIHNNNSKILRFASRELEKFQQIKKDFDQAKSAFSGKDLVDLNFEFQVRHNYKECDLSGST